MALPVNISLKKSKNEADANGTAIRSNKINIGNAFFIGTSLMFDILVEI